MNVRLLPLIHRQRWKLRVAFAAILVSGVAMLFDRQFSEALSVQPYLPTLAGTVLGFAALAFAVATVRCPECATSLVWLAVSQKSVGSWLTWLSDVSACPKCGHSASEESSGAKNAL